MVGPLKWAGRYPHPDHSRCDFEPEPGVVLAGSEAPCVACGAPTPWWDTAGLDAVCSAECRARTG